jgi:hypothetical protein
MCHQQKLFRKTHIFSKQRGKNNSFSFIIAEGKGRRMPVLTEEDNTASLFLFS